MNIIDIAKTVRDKEKVLDSHWRYIEKTQDYKDMYMSDETYTKADFENPAKSKSEIKKILGRQWKKQLSNLAAFCGLYKYCTSRKRVTELGISTHQEQLTEMFQSHQSTSNLISTALKVGLIQCVNDEYRFLNENFRDSEAYSKRYIWNKDVQDLIAEIVDEEEISYKKYTRKNKTYAAETGYLPVAIRDMIRVGSNLRISLKNVDIGLVKKELDERYPQVVECKEMANYDNEHFLNEREQIKCDWNITKSKTGRNISKIGFRATSGIVSFKAHDDGSDRYKGVWRNEYLESELGKGWYEYDVKSSIFRLTYFLNTGDWPDDNVDFYELMYGRKFESKEDRDAYKAYKMRPYFDSGDKVASHIMPAFDVSQKDEVRKLVKEDKVREEKIIGKSYKSEIFIHESCVYMKLVHRLRERGFRVIQVYDGFYCDQDFRKVIKEELKKVVFEYRNEIIRLNEQYQLFHCNHNQIYKINNNQFNIESELNKINNYIYINRENLREIDLENHENEPKLISELRDTIKVLVSHCLISVKTANGIAEEFLLDDRFTISKDQPTGFCVTNESIKVNRMLTSYLYRLRKQLNIQ